MVFSNKCDQLEVKMGDLLVIYDASERYRSSRQKKVVGNSDTTFRCITALVLVSRPRLPLPCILPLAEVRVPVVVHTGQAGDLAAFFVDFDAEIGDLFDQEQLVGHRHEPMLATAFALVVEMTVLVAQHARAVLAGVGLQYFLVDRHGILLGFQSGQRPFVPVFSRPLARGD